MVTVAGDSSALILNGPAADRLPADPSAPWLGWIGSSDDPANVTSVVQWLDQLEAELPERAAACREDEVRLAALWRHMVPKLTQFLPDEVAHIVSAQLEAAARRGAADALVDLVRAERRRLTDAGSESAVDGGVDADTLRRLLEGIASDRAITGRAVIAEALETLCSIALDLELTERKLGTGQAPIGETLADLRDHVTEAAKTLRALPHNVQVQPGADEQLAVAVNRCLGRYAGTLEANLEWSGGAESGWEQSSALLWVLQELLHHLHGAVAGRVTVAVDARPEITMTLTTPSQAFLVSAGEPDWMLRCRLRLQLADGRIRPVPLDSGSSVEVNVPAG